MREAFFFLFESSSLRVERRSARPDFALLGLLFFLEEGAPNPPPLLDLFLAWREDELARYFPGCKAGGAKAETDVDNRQRADTVSKHRGILQRDIVCDGIILFVYYDPR